MAYGTCAPAAGAGDRWRRFAVLPCHGQRAAHAPRLANVEADQPLRTGKSALGFVVPQDFGISRQMQEIAIREIDEQQARARIRVQIA